MGPSVSLSGLTHLFSLTSFFLLRASATSPCQATSPCKLGATDAYLSIGHGYQGNCATSVGTMRTMMIFVDFPDAHAPVYETPYKLFDVFHPEAAAWYRMSSYERLNMDVQADTTQFYRMPNISVAYGWSRGLTYETHQTYIQDAIAAYTAANEGKGLPTGLDVLYIVPTTVATAISFSTTFNGAVRPRAGSSSGGGGDPSQNAGQKSPVVAADIAKRAVTFGIDPFTTWGFKVMNHETGHAMCLPDLYPLPDGPPIGLYVGGWDMMGLVSGHSPDYFAWHKWRLGWLDDEQVQCVAGPGRTEHTLTPLHAKGGVKAVVVRQNGTDALVAEVRGGGGVDLNYCGYGVLLYTVSTALATGKGPIRVLDATPGSDSSRCGGNGYGVDDGTLSMDGARSLALPDWGVVVTLTGLNGGNYTVTVEKS